MHTSSTSSISNRLTFLTSMVVGGKPIPSVLTDIQIINAITFIDGCWDYPAVIAQNGSMLARARSILEAEYSSRGETLRQASKTLFDQVNKVGHHECPCCQRRLSKYWVTLNSGMASALFYMMTTSKRKKNGWVHMPSAEAKISRSSYSHLAHWGFVEKKPNPEGSNTFSSGMWRITPSGERFVQGGVYTPKKKRILMGKVCDVSKGLIQFADTRNVQFHKDGVYSDDDSDHGGDA